MNKAFTMFLWENDPSTNTPLSAENLNAVNAAVNTIDNRVVEMDTTKANQADMLTAFATVGYDQATGRITFTRKNGTTQVIDTKLEKLAVNFRYDNANQRLVITLDDGTEQYVDMRALITELEFLDSDTVLFTVDATGRVTASIVKGSITADMLEPNFLANVQLYASQALTSANDAAKSANSAGVSAEQAEANAALAQQYAEAAGDSLATVNKKLELATFTIDDRGHLIYTDNTSYIFTVVNGRLNYSLA